MLRIGRENDKITITVQNGGNVWAEICVKLACKQIFAQTFPSEEPPMILVRQSRARIHAVFAAK